MIGSLLLAAVAPLVVYASRIDERTDELPVAVRVLEAETIVRSGARDLPELLAKAANLQVRTLNGNPLQAQLALRGYGENSFGRIRIVVDGEELNGVDMESPDLSRIPLGAVSRVEILPGPCPVLYGDGAVAGVINIETDARDYARQSSATVQVGSEGTVGVGADTRGGLEGEGIQYSARGDYRHSDGFRRASDYDIYSVGGNLRKNFVNGSTLGISVNYSSSRYRLPGALDYRDWKRQREEAHSQWDSGRRWNYGVGLDGKMKLADDQWLYFDGEFSSKWRKASWGETRTASGEVGYANEYALYGYRLSPRYVNEKSLWGHDSKATAGLDFRFDDYRVTDRSGWNNPAYRFLRDRWSGFLQEEFFLTEELSVVAGARLERIGNRWRDYQTLDDPGRTDLEGDYELGLVYRPLEDLKTFLKSARYHRSPFCDEMNYTRDGRLLEPETGTSLDAGLEWQLATEFKYELSGYWNVAEDEIFYNPHASESPWGWTGYNCNSPGKTERLGFDTGFAWLRERVAEASLKYSFVHSRFASGQYVSRAVPLVPESRVRAEAGIWLGDDWELKGGCSYVTSQVLAGDFENVHERLPGYLLMDVGVHYQPRWAEGWRASLVLDNLLDREYCDFAGWSDYSGAYCYPAAGRSIMFTVRYEF